MKKKQNKLRYHDSLWGYLFIAPQYIGILLFVFIPLGFSLLLCFMKWDFIQSPQWNGLGNIKIIFSKALTGKVFLNTFIIVFGYIPPSLFFSILLALALDKNIRGRTGYRIIYFLPTIASTVSISMIFILLYNTDYGLINIFLKQLGISGPNWLRSTKMSLPSLIILTTWRGIGYNMIIILGGLQSIPSTYYEAALIDGANSFQRLKSITLPLLSSSIFFVIVILIIQMFKIFIEPFILTDGGPADSTNVVVLYLYRLAFDYFRVGEASVVSWILFITILIITLFQFKLSKWVYYET